MSRAPSWQMLGTTMSHASGQTGEPSRVLWTLLQGVCGIGRREGLESEAVCLLALSKHREKEARQVSCCTAQAFCSPAETGSRFEPSTAGLRSPEISGRYATSSWLELSGLATMSGEQPCFHCRHQHPHHHPALMHLAVGLP